ncbi:hypothetical protein [Streptomyces formicae]|uniref:Secreted protein n=1 Tax=Streptomyces formicae TaxID=1616117 RepID=A0ABY3X087_9ACTN|nr:hypothetical protein [Streptomyces formicae]UNM16161.1 hypothetical protein J4032_36090 [Streptomyces formicae]
MKKSTARTTVIALGAGATILSIASLSSAVASDIAATGQAAAQAADDAKPSCGPLDNLPGGPCDPNTDLGDDHPLPSRNPSDRNIKTDILQADWTRR